MNWAMTRSSGNTSPMARASHALGRFAASPLCGSGPKEMAGVRGIEAAYVCSPATVEDIRLRPWEGLDEHLLSSAVALRRARGANR